MQRDGFGHTQVEQRFKEFHAGAGANPLTTMGRKCGRTDAIVLALRAVDSKFGLLSDVMKVGA